MIIKKRDWKAHPTDAAVIEVDPQVSTETYGKETANAGENPVAPRVPGGSGTGAATKV